jgi:hypothetical protein
MFKCWKTLAFDAVLAVLGFLQVADWSIFSAPNAPCIAITAIGRGPAVHDQHAGDEEQLT